MQLTLTAEEAAMLKEILEVDLSDLRMEIADTDQKDFRDQLKKREDFLKKIVDQLAAG